MTLTWGDFESQIDRLDPNYNNGKEYNPFNETEHDPLYYEKVNDPLNRPWRKICEDDNLVGGIYLTYEQWRPLDGNPTGKLFLFSYKLVYSPSHSMPMFCFTVKDEVSGKLLTLEEFRKVFVERNKHRVPLAELNQMLTKQQHSFLLESPILTLYPCLTVNQLAKAPTATSKLETFIDVYGPLIFLHFNRDCPVCYEVFDTNQMMKGHVQEKHPRKPNLRKREAEKREAEILKYNSDQVQFIPKMSQNLTWEDFYTQIKDVVKSSDRLYNKWVLEEGFKVKYGEAFLSYRQTKSLDGTADGKVLFFQYHLTYNIIHSVPMLCFNVQDTETGKFLTLEEFMKVFVEKNERKVPNEDLKRIVTQIKYSLIPDCLALYPCLSVEEVIKVPTSTNMVQTFLNIYGPLVFLNPDLECELCRMDFSTDQMMRDHMQMEHPVNLSWDDFDSQIRDVIKISDRCNDNWMLETKTPPVGKYSQFLETKGDEPGWSFLSYKQKKVFEGRVYSFIYHVVYSQSYGAPMFYFNVQNTSSGQQLSLEEFRKVFVQKNQLNVPQMDLNLILTQMEHPLLFRPFLALHPCKTMDLLAKSPKSTNKVLTFISLYGPFIFLDLDLEYGLPQVRE